MDLANVILVQLSALCVTVCAMIETCDLKIALHDKIITSKMLWEFKGDKLACAAACMIDPHCMTFVYFPQRKRCIGYPKCPSKYSGNLADVKDGSSIVVKTCEARNIDDKCKRSNECCIEGSVCYARVCVCSPGFYYSPKHDCCLKECSEFGDGTDFYSELAIRSHNTRYYDRKSLKACAIACKRETTFTCLTADYNTHSKRCHLSRYGYLDVKKKDRLRHKRGKVMVQRRCK